MKNINCRNVVRVHLVPEFHYNNISGYLDHTLS
jgi:hypothetical protein